MKYGQFRDVQGFTPILFGKKKQLNKMAFLQSVSRSDDLNWIFTISKIKEYYTFFQDQLIGQSQSMNDKSYMNNTQRSHLISQLD